MLKHTFVISEREINHLVLGKIVERHTVTYQLSTKPFRLYNRFELPKKYELEDWENEDDLWFKSNGHFYNLNEFCRIGCAHIPGPHGGAQCASNGYFLIAAYEGEIYSVSVGECRPFRS